MNEYTKEEKVEALEDFEHFLFAMDDVLEEFIEQAARSNIALDYSLDSLDRVAEFALTKDARAGSDFHGQAAQYVGEVCRKHSNGKWELSLDMTNNSLYYGKPVVIKPGANGVQFSPYNVVNGFLFKKKTDLLKKAVTNYITPVKINLDHLADEVD